MGRMCRCYYCDGRRQERYELEGSGDGYEETPYRKKAKGKGCSKKKGSPCDFTVDVVKWSSGPRTLVILEGTAWEGHRNYIEENCVKACSRCGKQAWDKYFTRKRFL